LRDVREWSPSFRGGLRLKGSGVQTERGARSECVKWRDGNEFTKNRLIVLMSRKKGEKGAGEPFGSCER